VRAFGIATIAVIALAGCSAALPHQAGIYTIYNASPHTHLRHLIKGAPGTMLFVENVTGSLDDQIEQIDAGGALADTGDRGRWPEIFDLARTTSGAIWFTSADPMKAKYSVERIGGGLPSLDEDVHGTAYDIAAAPDGSAWFTVTSADTIDHVSPLGRITSYPIPRTRAMRHPGPWGLTLDAAGDVWFTLTWGNAIGRIGKDGKLHEFAVPTADSRPLDIAAGPDGNVWFTESAANRIGRISPKGTITEFGDSAMSDTPSVIVPGPDGALWFCETANVGRISTFGAISVHLAPYGACSGIAADGAGNIWFTQNIPAAYFGGPDRSAIATFHIRDWPSAAQ
jgi:virginiamycin B lyase